MKYSDPSEFFKFIIEKSDINVINDSQKCLALALDLLDCDKPYFKLLKIAFIFNAYKELLQAYKKDSNDKTLHIKKALKILTDECFINHEKAVWAVGWLANIIYPEEWNNFEKEFNNGIEKQVSNDAYIKQLQLEIESLKKQLEQRTNNNQAEELSLRASERGVAIQINNPLDSKNWTLEDIGLEMVYCPAGSFMMGSAAPVTDKKNYNGLFTDDIVNGELGRNIDEIQHQVFISRPFMIGKYPVTQKQYFLIMGNRPSFNKNDSNPVETVSWNDAKEFCERLNLLFKNQLPESYFFSLPSEAQWEYACRAGTTTSLNSGKNITSERDKCYNLEEVGWYKKNSYGMTRPVGLKKPNAWGIYDMHGNVWEWCQDLYGDYPPFPVTDPKGILKGSARVLRGGGWNYSAWRCRSASRHSDSPDRKCDYQGFRVALVPAE